MTDTPKQFPYGGSPSRWVAPRVVEARAAAIGATVEELPTFGSAEYLEPSFDDPTDDEAPSVADAVPAGEELDFDAGFLGATSVYDRPAPAVIGISAAGHVEAEAFHYDGWECDCKATAKSGIPPRHFQQYADGVWRIMISPGRGEVKQGKGDTGIARKGTPWVECSTWVPSEATYRGWVCSCASKADHRWDRQHASRHGTPGAVTLPDYAKLRLQELEGGAPLPATECPTWRPARRTWSRPGRDWRKLAPSLPAPVAPVVQPDHPAGPVGERSFLALSDLPPRCTVKGVLASGRVTSQLKARGRIVDDGPIVEQFRLAGELNGIRWVAYWTNGSFSSARVGSTPVNLSTLRQFLREGELP